MKKDVSNICVPIMQTRWGGCFHVRRGLVVQCNPAPLVSSTNVRYDNSVTERKREESRERGEEEGKKVQGKEERKEETQGETNKEEKARACLCWQNQTFLIISLACSKGVSRWVTWVLTPRGQRPIGELSLADISAPVVTTQLKQQLTEDERIRPVRLFGCLRSHTLTVTGSSATSSLSLSACRVCSSSSRSSVSPGPCALYVLRCLRVVGVCDGKDRANIQRIPKKPVWVLKKRVTVAWLAGLAESYSVWECGMRSPDFRQSVNNPVSTDLVISRSKDV